MIAGYAKNGYFKEPSQLFCKIQMTREAKYIFASIPPTCSFLAGLEYGKIVHVYVNEREFESDTFVRIVLADIFAKCGSIEDAWDIFDKIACTIHRLVESNNCRMG